MINNNKVKRVLLIMKIYAKYTKINIKIKIAFVTHLIFLMTNSLNIKNNFKIPMYLMPILNAANNVIY